MPFALPIFRGTKMKNDIHFKWSILIAGILFVLGLWGCWLFTTTMIEDVPFYFAGRQLLWLLTGMIALACGIPSFIREMSWS